MDDNKDVDERLNEYTDDMEEKTDLEKAGVTLRNTGTAIIVAAVMVSVGRFAYLLTDGFEDVRLFEIIAATLSGIHAVGLHYALKKWALSGWHRGITIFSFVAEIIMMVFINIAAANIEATIGLTITAYLAPVTVVQVLVSWFAIGAFDPYFVDKYKDAQEEAKSKRAVSRAKNQRILADAVLEAEVIKADIAKTLDKADKLKKARNKTNPQ